MHLGTVFYSPYSCPHFDFPICAVLQCASLPLPPQFHVLVRVAYCPWSTCVSTITFQLNLALCTYRDRPRRRRQRRHLSSSGSTPSDGVQRRAKPDGIDRRNRRRAQFSEQAVEEVLAQEEPQPQGRSRGASARSGSTSSGAPESPAVAAGRVAVDEEDVFTSPRFGQQSPLSRRLTDKMKEVTQLLSPQTSDTNI
eukprot:m.305625 g.305625  ORF g.305625 m.305625 type:complete len:196 (-) comp15910_c1_seq1:132-719(-)